MFIWNISCLLSRVEIDKPQSFLAFFVFIALNAGGIVSLISVYNY